MSKVQRNTTNLGLNTISHQEEYYNSILSPTSKCSDINHEGDYQLESFIYVERLLV